jgi:hypothetical protein
MRINDIHYSNVRDIPLGNLHTKQLLKLRESVRHRDPFGSDEDDDVWNGLSIKDKSWLQGELTKELATREHVPNKQEGKAARRARHKKGR